MHVAINRLLGAWSYGSAAIRGQQMTDLWFSDELPNQTELKLFTIRAEVTPGISALVRPVKSLRRSIDKHLPPSGAYYDEYILEGHFGKNKFQVYENGIVTTCIVCWGPKHENSYKRCKRQCRVCVTQDHPGKACGRIYAAVSWWRARGYAPPKDMHLRPGCGEWAYLVKAGVFHSFSRVIQPVQVNQSHPLVQEKYRAISVPLYTPGKPLWPALTKQKQGRDILRGNEEKHEQERQEEHQEECQQKSPAPTRVTNARRCLPQHHVPDMIGTAVQRTAQPTCVIGHGFGQGHSECSERILALEEQTARLYMEMKEIHAVIAVKDARIAGASGGEKTRIERDGGEN